VAAGEYVQERRISTEVTDCAIAQFPQTIAERFDNLNAVSPMKLIQLIGVTDDEVQRARLRSGRPGREKDLASRRCRRRPLLLAHPK
jgi:hypothetical protein